MNKFSIIFVLCIVFNLFEIGLSSKEKQINSGKKETFPVKANKYFSVSKLGDDSSVEWDKIRQPRSLENRKAHSDELKITNQNFTTNHAGEYKLSFDLPDGNRRVEIGDFESINSTKVFVIRGLFTFIKDDIHVNVLYKYDDTGFHLYEDPLSRPADFSIDSEECGKRPGQACIDPKLLNILVG